MVSSIEDAERLSAHSKTQLLDGYTLTSAAQTHIDCCNIKWRLKYHAPPKTKSILLMQKRANLVHNVVQLNATGGSACIMSSHE